MCYFNYHSDLICTPVLRTMIGRRRYSFLGSAISEPVLHTLKFGRIEECSIDKLSYS